MRQTKTKSDAKNRRNPPATRRRNGAENINFASHMSSQITSTLCISSAAAQARESLKLAPKESVCKLGKKRVTLPTSVLADFRIKSQESVGPVCVPSLVWLPQRYE